MGSSCCEQGWFRMGVGLVWGRFLADDTGWEFGTRHHIFIYMFQAVDPGWWGGWVVGPTRGGVGIASIIPKMRMMRGSGGTKPLGGGGGGTWPRDWYIYIYMHIYIYIYISGDSSYLLLSTKSNSRRKVTRRASPRGRSSLRWMIGMTWALCSDASRRGSVESLPWQLSSTCTVYV